MTASLIWVTPDAQASILKIARVSSPNPDSKETKLIGYLIKHGHWSPFEMVNLCIEVVTTRDISRQILRHRSCSFQEFSQRYATVTEFGRKRARLQDAKNRQMSHETDDDQVIAAWDNAQQQVINLTTKLYKEALDMGIAKEVARSLLPEGLAMTKLYVNGTLRSWIHYCQARLHGNGAQSEHSEIAVQIRDIIAKELPLVAKALEWPVDHQPSADSDVADRVDVHQKTANA